MKRWMIWTLNGLGLGLVAMFTANAGWLASPPRGKMKLIAHGGTTQQFDRKGVTEDSCTATRIEPPLHDYVDNTISSLQRADALGANMVQVDVTATSDGRLVLFHDRNLDCRTEGKGPVRAATLEQVQALNPGHGYTADGGRTFPLRYTGYGRIPTVEETLAALPATPILFTIKGTDPAEGALLASVLKAAGRDVVRKGDGFVAPDNVLAPLRAAFPKAWAFSPEGAEACTRSYIKSGWFTLVPESCKGGAILVPVNYQWAFPGWPDRMQARMAAANVRIVVIGPYEKSQMPQGLDLPEQIGDVPVSFTGYVWIDDIWTVGPAFHPAANRRSPGDEAAAAKAYTARRKARGLAEPQ